MSWSAWFVLRQRAISPALTGRLTAANDLCRFSRRIASRRAPRVRDGYIQDSRMDSKLSIALLEIFCGLSFVVCGVVLGFCVGWLGSPLLFPHDEQGLMRGLAVLCGAIVGALLGILGAAVAYFRLVRERRQRVATTALALAALTALFTAVAVQHFNYW